MKTLQVVISAASVIVMSGACAVFAQTSPEQGDATPPPAATATDPAKVNESPLVKAAKSGGPKKKSRISITDKDVKRSKGKLIEMSTTVESANRPVKPATEKTDEKAVDPNLNAQAERDKNVKAMQEKVEQARQQVSELEKELTRLEEDYYNEDDPGVRDDVIAKRFEDTKKRLETARQDLAAARANADAAASAPLTERRY